MAETSLKSNVLNKPKTNKTNMANTRTQALLTAPGIATAGIGALALIMSLATTRMSVEMIGVGLLFTGLLQIIFSFATGHWSGFAMHLFLAFTYSVAGGIAWMGPVGGSPYSVTLFLSLLFLTSGVLRMIISLTLPFATWSWAFWSGAVTTTFGIYCILQPQGPGPNLIGLLVAVDLILLGAYMTAFGFAKDSATVVEEADLSGREARV